MGTIVKDYDSESYDSGTYDGYELEGAPPRVVVNREHPPSKLAVLVRAPDGTPIARWAEDESKLENVLGSLGKSGDMPGGHTELSGALPRDPTKSYPDLALFSTAELQGVGGEKLWQGTIRQEPEDGERETIEVKAVGDKQFLEDDETVVGPGFIDGDLTKWGEPSAQRKLNLMPPASTYSPASAQTDIGWQGAGEAPPAIQMNLQYDNGHPIAESWYRGEGAPIGRLLYDYFVVGSLGEEAPNWHANAGISSDDLRTSLGALSFDHHFTGAIAQEISGIGGEAFLQVFYEGPYTGEGSNVAGWRNVKVVGPQGLTLQGTAWPNVGYVAKQMIPYIVEGSGLTTKDELLGDDGFVIPQAWFAAPSTRMSKLVEVTKYGLLDWFVFNDRILQYRFPETYGRKWRLSPGSGTPKNAGQDANRVWDQLMVTWQDVDGSTKTVGAPGMGAQSSDTRLQITDERNAAVAAGRPRRKLLALNGVCELEPAIRTGQRFLEEAQNLAQSGEATISGYCQDEYGIWWPAAYVQPGDWAADPGTQNYRKITSVNYSHDSKSASVTLGAPPEGISALEERMNAKLIELGLG